jgi:hypothetical protein
MLLNIQQALPHLRHPLSAEGHAPCSTGVSKGSLTFNRPCRTSAIRCLQKTTRRVLAALLAAAAAHAERPPRCMRFFQRHCGRTSILKEVEPPLDSWWFPTAGVPGWACGVSGAVSRQLVVSHSCGLRFSARDPANSAFLDGARCTAPTSHRVT